MKDERGFDYRWMDRLMDIGDCRVAFATEKALIMIHP